MNDDMKEMLKKAVPFVAGQTMWEVLEPALLGTALEQGLPEPADRVPLWNGFLMGLVKAMRKDLGDQETDAALARALVGNAGVKIEDIHIEKREAHKPSGTKH